MKLFSAFQRLHTHLAIVCIGGVLSVASLAQMPEAKWLAGDSHVHSHWSPGYDRSTTPPTPVPGLDALYPTTLNAQMAKRFGLSWMVTTDHGGPLHSKLNLTEAYPELVASRRSTPDLLQFYGMELNMPGMDHHTLIIPRVDFEASALYDLESRFDANERVPADAVHNTAGARVAALAYMASLPQLPLVFANHPSRSAKGLGRFGLVEPWEIRQSHDTAPEVYRGMEGAPGHQAGSLRRQQLNLPDEPRAAGSRGGYSASGAHTLGGFDQMTAVLGGLWDSLLGEGRRFWIVATSDSHVHYTETTRRGADFWPGEFHKTYVFARKTYADILEGLRAGRVFAVAGDLITSLDVEAVSSSGRATVGGTLRLQPSERVTLTIRFQDPETVNHGGFNPRVLRVDLIAGDVRGPLLDRHAFSNDTTRVVGRFHSDSWKRNGDQYEITFVMPAGTQDMYVRVRGTNGSDLEPSMDSPGENPWTDLWFYSNPIFLSVAPARSQED